MNIEFHIECRNDGRTNAIDTIGPDDTVIQGSKRELRWLNGSDDDEVAAETASDFKEI